MSDFLSQDQINELLNQQGSDAFGVKDVADEGAGPAQNTGPDYNALTSAVEFFNVHAASVVSNVLSKEIKLAVEKCEAIDTAALTGSISPPCLSVALPLQGAVNGVFYAVLSTKTVAVLSDLMMMGDGSAPYMDDHKDAIAELFNQIMGAFTTALGKQCGDAKVSAGAIEVKEFDFASPLYPLENSDMAVEKIVIGDTGEHLFGLLFQREISSQLMSKFKAGETLDSQDMSGGIGLSSSESDDLLKISEEATDFGTEESGFASAPAAKSKIKAPKENIDMLLDVEMDISIELGKTDLSIKRILELGPGAIVELDRMAGEPVDLLVNNKVVAKGEVVVVDESFGIRIVSLVSTEERIKSLR
ncbi:MAG: flagellar motor switch protein FliN [Dehalococcoidia bacterium]|nr:MAG: flagellar motor switch protein FliN [Dehalococcoidia bacterium]